MNAVPQGASPLAWLDAALAELDDHELRRTLRAVRPAGPGRIELEGRTLWNFGANDYLGLAADPRLAVAAQQAAAQYGWGAGASPLVMGRTALHAELETALARFEGTEAALLFPSGFAANAGAVAALVARDDAVFADAKNHASLIDGCRLAKAPTHIYRHGDVAHLEELLAANRGARRKLIVTDTLFSMDGDLAPLPALADLAMRHGAMLLVDEAHATGVFGANGSGLCEEMQTHCTGLIKVGTLSKALGCAGGFVAGPQTLIDWLANRARPYVFSTAHPAATAAAALAALDLVRTEPERRTALRQKAESLRGDLQRQGWNIGQSASPIIPLYVGAPQRAVELHRQLLEQGCFVPAIRPPSVPPGESLLRISLSAAHPPASLEVLLNALQAHRTGD